MFKLQRLSFAFLCRIFVGFSGHYKFVTRISFFVVHRSFSSDSVDSSSFCELDSMLASHALFSDDLKSFKVFMEVNFIFVVTFPEKIICLHSEQL